MNRTNSYNSAVVQPAILNPYERKLAFEATTQTFKYSPPANLSLTNPKSQGERFTFKQLGDSQEIGSRNEVRHEYFGTQVTSQ